ncbi:MAG: SPOR domain-containing protein [Flavobacteriaceae bacterium]
MNNSILTICFFLVVFLITKPTYSQSEKSDNTLINELIAKKRNFNKEFSYGFRIQLYNGIEAAARKTMMKFKNDFPEIKTYLVYRQPEWKIQVGFYKTKLDADRALLKFKRKYQSAIVIPLGK